MDFKQLLGKFASPKLALGMLTKMIEEMVKHDVEKYVMKMNIVEKKVLFKIYWTSKKPRPINYQNDDSSHTYILDGEEKDKLIKLISSGASEKLEKNTQIDYVYMSVENCAYHLDLYYVQDNIKKTKSIQL
jgi:hypothetical protein